MMQHKTVHLASKAGRLRRKLHGRLPLMHGSRGHRLHAGGIVDVMRTVILVILQLRPHLLLQVVLLFNQLLFRFINLLLQAVAGVVAEVAWLRSFGWALAWRFLVHLTKILQARRCPGGHLELMVIQSRELERLVPLVSARPRKSVRRIW